MRCNSADFSIVNFESPVIEEVFIPIRKNGPNLHTSAEAIEAVKYAGFNGVALANNHISDYGEQGLMKTVKCCRENGLEVVGVGEDIEEARAVLYYEKGGEKLAVINCCEHEFSIATEKKAGANPLNPIRIYYDIQDAKLKADYILVIVHGGHELYQLPSARMQETYRFFIDSGADAVVNHHQHCFSGYEEYYGKPIFYGLGNFCFDEDGNLDKNWYDGYMVKIKFNKGGVKYELYPYIQCRENTSVKLLQNRIEFDKRIGSINKIIKDSQKLQTANEEYYLKSINDINTMYQPYMNRIFRKLFRLHLLPSFVSKRKILQILNYAECESHRDKQIFALKKMLRN